MLPVIRLPLDLFTSGFPSVLRQRADAVQRFDERLARFVKELRLTLNELGGGGIAAPQVGVPLCIALLDVRAPSHPLDPGPPAPGFEPLTACLVNPEVVSRSDDEESGIESCYSLPGYAGIVSRPTRVAISASDEHGAPVRLELRGFTARVVMHELDHLDGVLYSDLAVGPLVRGEAVAVGGQA